MLTAKEIHTLLGALQRRAFTLHLSGDQLEVSSMVRQTGYSDDPETSALQAKLSIMLQVATQEEARKR